MLSELKMEGDVKPFFLLFSFLFWLKCLGLVGTACCERVIWVFDEKQERVAGGGWQFFVSFGFRYLHEFAWKRPFLVSVFLGADLLLFDVERLVGALGADTEVGFAVHFAEEIVVVSAL